MKRLSCRSCGGLRLMDVLGKCGDLFSLKLGVFMHEGYVPHGFNVGSGDYIDFQLCLDCGRIQGEFPISLEATAKVFQN
jgi:hypothetical protein